jgi:hypothetical protein
VTDLDILGYAFDSSGNAVKRIGEVKSGRANNTPKALDRALWLHGLRALVGATSSEFTTAFHPSAATVDLCGRLGTKVQHLDDLARREQRLNMESVATVGSQSDSVALARRRIAKLVKAEPRLERAWWFLTSEVWFLEPLDALKRTLGVIRELHRHWPPEAHTSEMEAVRWFYAEAISVAVLNMALVAAEANGMGRELFTTSVTNRLSTGDIPAHAMHKLSEQVDLYMGRILSKIDAPPEVITESMGAFTPTPPDYAEPLIELLTRLAADSAASSRLPRQADAVLFERLVHRRMVSATVLERLGCTPTTERMLRLIAAFLRGQFHLPDPVVKVLTTPLFEVAELPGELVDAPAAHESAGSAGPGSPPLDADEAAANATLFNATEGN